MAELRRQGLTFAEIGRRQSCSERTARRFVGKVEPKLQLPSPDDSEPAPDPATLRERFTRELLETLYREPRLNGLYRAKRLTGPGPQDCIYTYSGPPSIVFLNEAERLIREGLDALSPLSLSRLAQDQGLRQRFLRAGVGALYRDYLSWHQFYHNLGEIGDTWRPPRERSPIEAEDDLVEENAE